jgi:hypothetical protein
LYILVCEHLVGTALVEGETEHPIEKIGFARFFQKTL